ncbi:LexA family transcriptional regulator [Zophobihabitans entericus]|uniref:Helix-turn-helix transcriptional regulator n=1 Tax=Zophobihabitans entericus TaxID=1635327 RepID=A0A6G9IAJ9_9GAMM|nr:S24 family peptidase [Zophobihabitans entericus]QIQ21258.1 helix-turn-helix transcriptional regulator [Zophobihabitans entericus]
METSTFYNVNECDDDKEHILKESGILSFKERLLIAMQGLSGNSFAKKVGMSEAVIRDYLSGRTYPSLNRAAIIASKCNVPLEWLVTGKGSCTLTKEEEVFVTLPVFASDIPEYAQPTGFTPSLGLPFDASWISYRGFNKDDLMVFWAKGDSMSSTITNHDALIVNTANKHPMDGYIYIVKHGEHVTTKRIQVRARSLMLISDNPAYPPITINIEERDDFEIIGRVVYILKEVY